MEMRLRLSQPIRETEMLRVQQDEAIAMTNQPGSRNDGATKRTDAWRLYCDAFHKIYPNAGAVSKTVSPAVLEEMVESLAPRSEIKPTMGGCGAREPHVTAAAEGEETAASLHNAAPQAPNVPSQLHGNAEESASGSKKETARDGFQPAAAAPLSTLSSTAAPRPKDAILTVYMTLEQHDRWTAFNDARSAERSAEEAAAWAVIACADEEMLDVVIGKPEYVRPGERIEPLFFAPVSASKEPSE